MANTLGLLPWFGAYFRFLPGIGSGLRNFRAAAIQRVLRRKEKGSVRKDLFHHLVSPAPPQPRRNGSDLSLLRQIDEANHEPTPPPTAQVTADATLAMIAGSDTTASVLSNAYYHLLTNPSVYACLREEVDGLFDAERRDCANDVDADGVDVEEIRKLPWLNAVM
jgi:cytochrome P450